MSESIGLGDTQAAESSSIDDTPMATLVAERYELLGLVGRGGMGAVYRARDRVLDETVALKMLRRELLGSADAIARFVQEVKLARKVTHPCVARTFDIGEHGADRFLTMEWIDGESLGSRIEREGRLPRAEALRVVVGICDGVEAAHAAAVVHRDLKPDNVLLARDGRVVVTDFGIARPATGTSRTEGIVGTPAYMAPDQIEGGKLDARTDVYAIGEILYELLTGERAWTGDNPFVVVLAKMRDAPPDPGAKGAASPELAAITRRCMERAPNDRYADVRTLREALREAARAPEPSSPAPPRAASRDGRPALSLAVRPFRNAAAGDSDDLARGLAEDVLDTLSTAPGLRVRSAPDSELDSRSLGRELSVDVVLEGTLRRVGEETRFSARVISVADGFHVWAHRFVTPHADLLGVADDAANAIARALAAHVSTPRRAAVDPIALDCYLRGRDLMRRSWYTIGGEASGAIALFDEALARVPDDPTFLATTAMAYTRSSRGGSVDVATASAMRAIELAPHLPDPWLALALVKGTAGDTMSAIPPAAEAHRRGPSLAGPLAFFGGLFDEIGPPEVARRYLERAAETDPSSGAVLVPLLRTLFFAGDHEELRRRVASGADAHNYPILGGFCSRLAIWTGDETWLLDTSSSQVKKWPLTAMLADALEHRQVHGESLRNIRELRRNGVRFWRFACQLAAETTAACKDPQAFDWLQESLDNGLHDLVWMDRCPALGSLRGDPRFAPMHAIVRERADALRAAAAREGHA